jgi:RNA recognition motif-containing protein
MTKLFVGGLPYATTNSELQEMFAQFGDVVSAQIIMDKFSGQSKGFGFVEMSDDNAAQTAINELNGSDFQGRKLGVSVARPREERPSNGGGGFNRDRNGGGNRGGFDRNRGGGRDNRGGGNRGGGRY